MTVGHWRLLGCCLGSFSDAVTEPYDQGNLESISFGAYGSRRLESMTSWWEEWQQADRHAAGTIVKSLHLNSQTRGRES